MMGCRTVQASRVLHVPREAMLELMSQIPELSDLLITVMAARRRRLLESQDAALVLIGADVDRNIRQIAAFAGRNKFPYRSFEIGSGEALEVSAECSITPRSPLCSTATSKPSMTPRRKRSPSFSGSIWCWRIMRFAMC